MTHHLISVANVEKLSAQATAEVWSPPPSVDYLRWAESNIVFTERESQFPGPYNRELFCYFDEILRALSPDDPCRIVTLAKSAQIGGTVLANIFCLGSLVMDPGDILYVHPTEGNAQRWSKTKLTPMLKNTSCLTPLFPQKSRDGHDSVLYKERIDGRGAITIGGANSPSSLSMITVARQVQDDLSKWEDNAAGDPEKQADSRSRGRSFAKILKISTPLVEPGCRITKSFKAGSQEELHVPCPHCGHMQVLEHENLAQSFDEAAPERAHFTCEDPECGGVIEQYDIPEMMKKAQWIAKHPERKRYHRSFHIWSAYSVLQSLETVCREYFAAKGDPESEKTYLNDTVGLAYVAKGEAPPWEVLRDRAAESEYSVGTVPAGYPILTCGVDCQKDRVEAQIVAWGPRNRRAIVDYRVFEGHISSDKCRASLNGLLKEAFRNQHGNRIPIDILAIDGNAYTEDVWEWARKHPISKVIMVRGNPNDQSPRIQQVKNEHSDKGKKKRYAKRFFNFNASLLKMALYRNLTILDPLERSYVALPKGLDDEFFRQITAERRIAKKNKRGFKDYVWEKDPNQANEGLDTNLQAEIAATKFGVRSMPRAIWDKYFSERECEPEHVQTDIEDLLATAQVVEPKATPDQKPEKKPVGSSPAKSKWGSRLG